MLLPLTFLLLGGLALWCEEWTITAELDRQRNHMTVERLSYHRIDREIFDLSALTNIDVEFDSEDIEAKLKLHFDNRDDVVTLPVFCWGFLSNREQDVQALHDDLRQWTGLDAGGPKTGIPI